MRRFLTDIIKILINTFFFSSSETSEFHQNAIEVIYKQLSQAKKKRRNKIWVLMRIQYKTPSLSVLPDYPTCVTYGRETYDS